jgi:hypothetical protein
MISRRKRRRLIVRRGREETEEEPLLLSMVCVILRYPFREGMMGEKRRRCSCQHAVADALVALHQLKAQGRLLEMIAQRQT